MRTVLTMALLLAASLLAACGGEGEGGDPGRVRVVATTAQLGDFARQVGGDRVRVDVLLPPGADPHEYEPRPSDARALAEADLVLQSGGDLDAWLGDVLASAGSDARRLTLIDVVDTLDHDGAGAHADDGAGGHADDDAAAPDPHWWQDPRNAERAVARIAVELARVDPEGRPGYERRARAYIDRIREVDEEIEQCIDSVPEERRTLITTHDAFGYLAERYDIRVLGSIIPGRSTSARPSARDVRELVRTIRREDVKTIFPEAALGQRLEEAVARDAGARVGEPLYADALGPEGSPGESYLGALRHDALAIARGFGADC